MNRFKPTTLEDQADFAAEAVNVVPNFVALVQDLCFNDASDELVDMENATAEVLEGQDPVWDGEYSVLPGLHSDEEIDSVTRIDAAISLRGDHGSVKVYEISCIYGLGPFFALSYKDDPSLSVVDRFEYIDESFPGWWPKDMLGKFRQVLDRIGLLQTAGRLQPITRTADLPD